MCLTQLILRLDRDDLRDIHEAIKRRDALAIMPDGMSDPTGASLAEICRGWMEYHDDEVGRSGTPS